MTKFPAANARKARTKSRERVQDLIAEILAWREQFRDDETAAAGRFAAANAQGRVTAASALRREQARYDREAAESAADSLQTAANALRDFLNNRASQPNPLAVDTAGE